MLDETSKIIVNLINKISKTESDFEQIMRKNEENRKRVEEDRKKSNKSVIKSERLKH